MDLPTIGHPTDRPNFTRVTVGDLTLWFSYQTCVAFNAHDGNGPVVRKNEWGPTTGKHLNYIDNMRKDTRVNEAAFTASLKLQLAAVNA